MYLSTLIVNSIVQRLIIESHDIEEAVWQTASSCSFFSLNVFFDLLRSEEMPEFNANLEDVFIINFINSDYVLEPSIDALNEITTKWIRLIVCSLFNPF